MIKELIAKFTHRNDKYKEAEEERRINKTLEAREKNSNERELLRFKEEARQEIIKKQLEAYRKQRARELWESKMFARGNTQSRTVLKKQTKLNIKVPEINNWNMFFGRGDK